MRHMPPTLPNADPTAVRDELTRILASSEFASSNRFRRFLSFVVSESLAGREDTLKAYTIAVEVFEREKNFDPQTNAVVRVEAIRLRNRLDSYYLAHPPTNGVKITLPKGGYRPVFQRIDQGIDQRLDQGKSGATAQPARGILRSRLKPTIAVLAFANLESDEHGAALARALSEEITLGLTYFDDFTVISAPAQTDDERPPGAPWDMAKAAGARFILSGSVQIIFNTARVRVSLVDAETRSSLWAEKFDRAFSEQHLFGVLDEITSHVVMRVGDGFGFINRFLAKEKAYKDTADLEIYEAVLRYHHWVMTLSPERGEVAIPALERAMELDPGYALPYAMLSDLYAGYYQWGQETGPDFPEKSWDLAVKALDIDAGCQHAQWARAYNLYLRGDKNQFLEVVHKAVAINPYNFNIISTAGIKICMLGDWERGLELVNRGKHLGLDMPGWIYVAEVFYHYLNNDFAKALAKAKLIATPGFFGGPLLRAAIYGQMGLYMQGHAEVTELLAICPKFRHNCRELLRRSFFQPVHVDSLLQGLRSSGFTPA